MFIKTFKKDTAMNKFERSSAKDDDFFYDEAVLERILNQSNSKSNTATFANLETAAVQYNESQNYPDNLDEILMSNSKSFLTSGSVS